MLYSYGAYSGNVKLSVSDGAVDKTQVPSTTGTVGAAPAIHRMLLNHSGVCALMRVMHLAVKYNRSEVGSLLVSNLLLCTFPALRQKRTAEKTMEEAM